MADNLLDKASILLTPTAYDNGSMLSIKPENGDGDFDFQRNSAATRVNAQGLVENVQIISPELVSNGNFSQIGTEEVLNGNFSQQGSEQVTNGDFSVNGVVNTSSYTLGWYSPDSDLSISDGKLIITNGASVGGRAYGTNGVNSISFLTSGKSYKLVYTIIENNDNASVLYHNGGAYVTAPNTVGTHTIYYQADGVIFILRNNTANTTIKIDNVSVKEVGQNWSLGTGWSIGDDKATHTGSQSLLAQYNIITIGKSYRISFDLTNTDDSNYVRLISSQYPNGGDYKTDGTHVVYTSTNIAHFWIYGIGDISITNISVKEVGQDWTLGSGWSIGDGVANYNDNANNQIAQNINLNAGSYKLNFSISNTTGSGGRIWIGNFGGSVSYTDNSYQYYINGDYTLNINVPSNQTTFAFYGEISGSSFDISNVSVKEITDDTNIPRINYEGFSYQDSLGSEEIVNGDFSNGNANWIFNNSGGSFGWQIYDGKAICDGNALTPNRNLNSTFSLTNGKAYKLTLDILQSEDNMIILVGSTSLSQTLPTGTNLNYEYIITDSMHSGGIFSLYGGSSDLQEIDNVSVKEYLGQEVVPDSGCGSWLLEPQSTNLIPYSEDFTQSNWIKHSAVVLTSGQLSPDGGNNAYKVQGSIGSSFLLDGGFSAITPQSRSIYMRADTNGVIYTLGDNQSNQINVTTEWQRFELQEVSIAVYAVDFRGSGVTLDTVYVWGAQLENLPYATSYIPTFGATNTRLQDIANNSGNASLINSTEGVLYAEIAALANDGTNRFIIMNDSTSNNRLTFRYRGDNQLAMEVHISGVLKASISYNSPDIKETQKVALKYKQNNYALWVNGVEVGVDTLNEIWSSNTLNNIDFVGFGQPFFGKTKALAVYKEALTDAELQSLTTI